MNDEIIESLSYEDIEHPGKDWLYGDKFVYLQLLVLVMNANGIANAAKINWFRTLINSMEIEEDKTLRLLSAFTGTFNDDITFDNSTINCIRDKQQIFLFDALILCHLDIYNIELGLRVIKKLAQQLGVPEAIWHAILDLFSQVQNVGITDTRFNSSLVDKNQFGQIFKTATSNKFSNEYSKQSFLKTLGKFVKIPSGNFMMSSNKIHSTYKVSVKEFLLQESLVTFAMWDAFVEESGCYYSPHDSGWGRNNRPVISVSFEDITELFIPWVNQATNMNFRLPSEAEWEYSCRAGTITKYYYGDEISHDQAHFSNGSTIGTKPVKSYSPNAFGLYDMHGNVWEWTQDCWDEHNENVPINGNANLTGDCNKRILRGGSWNNYSDWLTSSYRIVMDTDTRLAVFGFRLAHDLY